MNFSHLHVHTQYSLLDGAAQIESLMKNAKANGMTSLAITDHGNMFGVPEFVAKAKEHGILPVIGCEFYIARGSRFEKSKSEEADEKNIFHQLILAKNKTGYKNLSKLCTLGFTEGFYYKPRIDKEIIRKYREGLIATTCCLASEINQMIIRKGEGEAEKLFLEWLDIFGEDYYIEIQRHGIKEQDICNEILIRWAKKYNVKMIATNDVHYVDIKDSQAQDILLCLQTRKDFDDKNRMRFENNQFYLKTKEEMEKIFEDIPEALDNTEEIISKIEAPELKRDILLPIFSLPEGFTDADNYLKHVSYEGARKRYGELSQEVLTRLDFELSVVKNMGFAGYFLIVRDFIAAARGLGVSVGPGRGSAAGSIVAYCTEITNIDPIAYNLLFERFLNPERVSMPDIDIDFDDTGRQKVINYVVEKYGQNRVAQIITFGTMAAKSSIRDVARVLKLPLAEADRLAKLVPTRPGTSLKSAFKDVKELADARNSGNPLITRTLDFAEVLEGCARHTGVHAAGIIIAPDDLSEYVPLCTSKESALLVTQYEGGYVEHVGMLKMDFLGLKTLTIIKDALELIDRNHGLKIDIDKIPLDDQKTYELFQRGDTIATFQFESEGMRAYLKELKPNTIEDLIAMNALYRPGPMEYIPSYINRKHGREKVSFPHPVVEQILQPTYGIIVYQEQVMLIVQELAGFTKGQADTLRKAMGKKNKELLEKQRESFVKGASEKGVPEATSIDLFDKMAKFGEYAFNRSHSAAYSVLAYQTGYLKANYTAEFMASTLTNNIGDMDNLSMFMDECRRLNIQVQGPDVNESFFKFAVNKKGEIRFGLGAVKGVGEAAATTIVEDRLQNGIYNSIYEVASRVNLRAANKKCFEALAAAGAFDSFKGVHRAQYFYTNGGTQSSGIEMAIRYGSDAQQNLNSQQQSLFGGDQAVFEVHEPKLPACEKWSKLEQLRQEKDVTGIYISGHPLDDYKFEMRHFCNVKVTELSSLENLKGKEITFAGIVTAFESKTTKSGKPFAQFTLEDYNGSYQLALFSDDFTRYKSFIETNTFIFVRAKVQPRYNSADMLEVKISQINKLSEVRNLLARSITMQVSSKDVDEQWIQRMKTLSSAFPGNCRIKFLLVDRDEKYVAELPARKTKVSVNNEFLSGLESFTGLSYRINDTISSVGIKNGVPT